MPEPSPADDLVARLRAGRVVSLPGDAWEAVRPRFDAVSCHPTGLAGDLVVARGPGDMLVAVEEPPEGGRVVRLLDGPEEARAFVAGRLALYERMWDGCGCRIDYREGASDPAR